MSMVDPTIERDEETAEGGELVVPAIQSRPAESRAAKLGCAR